MDSIPSVVIDGESVCGIPAAIADALAQARAFGYLGPGPLQRHIDHARGFADALEASGIASESAAPFEAVDLGSGGGVPGLLLLTWFPQSHWTFVDSNSRRMRTLSEVLINLALADRALVRVGRAEDVARDPQVRGAFDLLVARGFSAPAVTAECGSAFLRKGGIMIVSEPPGDTDRWPDRGLARLGLKREEIVQGQFRFFVARQERRTPNTFPRQVGIPGKAPLF